MYNIVEATILKEKCKVESVSIPLINLIPNDILIICDATSFIINK